jgi:hypothetical protein
MDVSLAQTFLTRGGWWGCEADKKESCFFLYPHEEIYQDLYPESNMVFNTSLQELYATGMGVIYLVSFLNHK